MQHFNDETWSDFTRGTAAPDIRDQVEQHLSNNCSECAAQARTWKNLAQMAQQESSFTPPPDLVRLVKLEFGLQQPQLEPVVASLMFDTYSQPLAAGIRSGGVTARQVLYEAGGIAVDLRLESQPGSAQICAVGQVQDRSTRASLRPSIPVSLLGQAGETLKRIITNEFGEFQFEFVRDRVARIAIEIDANRVIHIPIAELEGYLQAS